MPPSHGPDLAGAYETVAESVRTAYETGRETVYSTGPEVLAAADNPTAGLDSETMVWFALGHLAVTAALGYGTYKVLSRLEDDDAGAASAEDIDRQLEPEGADRDGEAVDDLLDGEDGGR